MGYLVFFDVCFFRFDSKKVRLKIKFITGHIIKDGFYEVRAFFNSNDTGKCKFQLIYNPDKKVGFIRCLKYFVA